MLKTLRREFGWKQFRFHYNRPLDFAVWSWQLGKRDGVCGYYVAYRCLLATLFLSILVADGCLLTYPAGYFFIYFTNLGFIAQTLQLTVSAAVPIQFLLQQQSKTGKLEWNLLARFSWFLYEATNISSLVISIIYWVVLYEPGTPIEARDFLVHGFNSIATFFDILLGGRPNRLMHFYPDQIFQLAYTSFTAIYWAAGGRTETGSSYIYPVLDWDNLALTVPFVVVGLVVIVPIMHGLFWSLHLLRNRVLRVKNGFQVKNQQGRFNSAFSDARL